MRLRWLVASFLGVLAWNLSALTSASGANQQSRPELPSATPPVGSVHRSSDGRIVPANAPSRLRGGENIPLTPFCSALLSKPRSTPAVPAPRTSDVSWSEKFERLKSESYKATPDILLVGNSITEFWRDEIKRALPGMSILNIGVGGDQTENILWRIENGDLPSRSPAYIVLLAGTNNTENPHLSGDDIAQGIAAIVRELRARLPDARVLVISVLPRGEFATEPRRQPLQRANALVAKCADDRAVFYVDVWSKFLEPNGAIRKDLMTPDYLHVGGGYGIIDDAIAAMIRKIQDRSPSD